MELTEWTGSTQTPGDVQTQKDTVESVENLSRICRTWSRQAIGLDKRTLMVETLMKCMQGFGQTFEHPLTFSVVAKDALS